MVFATKCCVLGIVIAVVLPIMWMLFAAVVVGEASERLIDNIDSAVDRVFIWAGAKK